ncbi:threonylcarbamoyl-AMP synthase [Candidatus Woesearchaeota archaeon RBG_13_36_6]|nr:MAG: threonylcarbamoyl-AMP synthase [Candidatus Woesearchaeota archaeon RBG_13_36_6]
MRILTKDELLLDKAKFISRIRKGVIFIHPTDTIYGIGCSVLSSQAVNKVREIKQRRFMPFSILVPSKEWIYENCNTDDKVEEWIKKLPGPYTLILTLKNKSAIVPEVNNSLRTVGVRIPDHWFSDFVKELGFPIITTSANIVGENFMTSLENLDDRIKSKLNFIIYEDEKKGRPSTIVDLSKKEPQITKR